MFCDFELVTVAFALPPPPPSLPFKLGPYNIEMSLLNTEEAPSSR